MRGQEATALSCIDKLYADNLEADQTRWQSFALQCLADTEWLVAGLQVEDDNSNACYKLHTKP